MAEERFGPLEPRSACDPATICGSSHSSTIALPSAMRSGQNATSTSRPSSRDSRSTIAVTPGYTVLRSTRSWPSRSSGTMSAIAFGTAHEIGVEVLVDRRADHDHHSLCPLQHALVTRDGQGAGIENPSQKLLGMGLLEWHVPRADRRYGLAVDVVQRDLGTRVGEHKTERQPDMTAPTENDDIEIEHGSSPGRAISWLTRRACGAPASVTHASARSRPDGRFGSRGKSAEHSTHLGIHLRRGLGASSMFDLDTASFGGRGARSSRHSPACSHP